jgi:hypothetical protein
MKFYISLMYLFLIYTKVNAQKNLSPIKKWKKYSIPNDYNVLETYSKSSNNCKVYKVNSEIQVDTNYNYKNECYLPFEIDRNTVSPFIFTKNKFIKEVNNGFLIGFNKGEWGGKLYWFSRDGKISYEISNHQILQFFEWNNKLFAIEGLEHLSTTKGSIILIEKLNAKWIAKKYLELPECGYSVDLDAKNNLVIVTSSKLLYLERNKKITTLINNGFWKIHLYPINLLVDKNSVYIGFTKGVLSYNLNTKIKYWYLLN